MINDMNNTVLKSARDMLIDTMLETTYKNHQPKTFEDLNGLCDRFDQLLRSDLSNNNQLRLFCRQLKRFMDNNEEVKYHFWIELDDYLNYVLDEPSSKQIKNTHLELFLERITFEKELEQRQKEFQEEVKEQKSLQQLIKEHKKFLKKYLRTCISLHSTIQVTDLIDNIDDFLCNNYGPTHLPLTQKNRQRLEEKPVCIEIPLDYLDRSLADKSSVFSTDADLKKSLSSSPNSFLTSANPELTIESERLSTTDVLESERWLVILGDPGNGKTTLLRSIMGIYADAFYNDHYKVILRRHKHTAFRIPVLIRVGEYASWLENNPRKSLIQYIGEHTWFSKKYYQNDSGNVLKEFIYHGHALILLDGLDEIPEVRRREEIVTLIREFIHQYVKDPNFISAFDKKLFDHFQPKFRINETQSPSKFGGNQIIITSRIVGYDMNPLIGTFITHCLLLHMDEDDANKFVEKWMSHVERVVHEVLRSKRIRIDKQTRNILSQRRIEAMKSIFNNNNKLLFNSSLLTLICTAIFRLSDEFHPKSRVEVFNHAVESAFRFWTKHESSTFPELLSQFLINLSTYLHLQSSAGLIDTFDITQLARLTVKKQYMINNREKLREYGDKLLKVLESNTGIVTDRGLQVFGFQHLSFQEYFVAQSLVKRHFTDGNIRKEYSIEEIANRILFFTINSRFREPLLMALDWISWKWSSDEFDQFCTVFVRSNEKYSIPLGALVLFDALNDMRRLPSESVIFTALNSLLNHPSNMIAERYLIPNLFKLSADMIGKWMSRHFKDDQSFSKFCQCLLMEFEFEYRFKQSSSDRKYQKSKCSLICKQLYSFYNDGTSAKFVIDQTLRRIMMLAGTPDEIFPHQWISYFEHQKINVSTIHPLILSILIVVCGGVIWPGETESIKIYWSHRRIYHQSSIMKPIIEYLMNQKQSHSIKVQTLIEQYERVIKKTSSSDISNDIVDTFIALICLHKISNHFIIQNYSNYSALSMAFKKIKHTYFFITRIFYKEYHGQCEWLETLFINTVRSIIEMFYSHSHRDYSTTIYNVALKKLFIRWPVGSFSSENSDGNNDDYLESRSEFGHLHEERKQNFIEENFQDDLSLLLTFIPLSLQKLYDCLFINPSDKTDSLPLVIFLSQCLIYLENVHKSHPNFAIILTKLKSQCKEHMLENYLSILLFKNNLKKENEEHWSDELTLFEPMYINPCDNWQKLIDIECQRISEANNIKENEVKDCRLFAASICLARLSQVQYYSPPYDSTTNNTLSTSLGETISNAIENIHDPILRIIALDMILEMKDPFNFDEKQRNDLDLERARQLKDFRKFPLLKLTFMVARFYTQQKDLPIIPSMIKVIVKRFGETSIDRNRHSREAVLIALKQLGNLYYLSKSFDPNEWNSSLLFQCFNQATSFDSLNTTILSFIYVTELAFDAHLLQMYTNVHYKTKIFHIKRSIPQGINSSSNDKIMTEEAAIWITNYLQKPSSKDILRQVIAFTYECLKIEEKALAEIEKWLTYRNEEKLRIFAHYAALQLFIKHSNLSHLIDIINEILTIEDEIHVNSFIEHIFNSRVNDLNILHQILIKWQTNLFYSSNISIWISHQKIFDSILDFELERITRNENKPLQLPSKSFLFIVKGCSYDLQVNLKQHLQTFIEQNNKENNVLKEQYVASIIQWIIESKIWNDSNKKFAKELYNYVFSFFDHQSYHYVQKAILISLHSVLRKFYWKNEKHVLMTTTAISHVEKIISSYRQYSDDVLAVCLLTYGIYLSKLIEINKICHVSDGIQEILTKLFTLAPTKIISIRAGLCLIIAEQSSEVFNEIPHLFKEKWKLTVEDEYDMLLQQTLFEKEDLHSLKRSQIDNYISSHSAELLNKFVCELKNDLDNKCNNYYSSDPSPNYVQIANEFSGENFRIFQNALQPDSIDETTLKKQLYQYAYYAKTTTDYEVAIQLYGKFGILTEELRQMLEWAEVRYASGRPISLNNINEVSDRKVIEMLFKKLKFVINNGKFQFGLFILRLLIRLASNDVGSSLEVHQQVSNIINEFSQNNKVPDWFRESFIFDELLDLSSIEKTLDDVFSHKEAELFSENDIDFEFEKKIDQLKRLPM